MVPAADLALDAALLMGALDARKGSRGRRRRDITAAADQCGQALRLVEDFIEPTAKALKAAGKQ